jgi:hypothetical protein
MIKKALIGGAGACLVAGFLFGTDALSYVTTSAGWVKDSVKDSVPLEFEIERARQMVKDLVPDIENNMHVIAKEEVEVERLQKQIEQAEKDQVLDQTGLIRLKSDLESGKSVFKYAGRSYTADQVKLDLANRFDRYKTKDATLASLRDIHQARQKSLEAARQKLEGMLAARRKLETDVANCEARLKMVEAAQTTSEFSFDDSRLGRAKELISDIKTRLDVAAKMIDAKDSLHSEIPLNEAAPDDIVDEVTEYFSGNNRPQVAAQ